MSVPPDSPAFRRFKQRARLLHEAAKISEARRNVVGSGIADSELRAALAEIDAWLARQPEHVREFALMAPAPRRVRA